MRVIHVAPTAFGASGVLGGGERYPLELARALASEIECRLITFGPKPGRWRDPSGLHIQVLRPAGLLWKHPAHPLAPALVAALRGAHLLHTHHMRSTPSRMAVLSGRLGRQPVVVTDHGLQGSSWGGVLPRLFDRLLAVSAFSARELHFPPERTRIVFGGADPVRYRPDPETQRRGVLFVGRITPHKGVDRLIAALPPDAELLVVGSAGHDPEPPERDYPELLRQMARVRQVRFLGPVGDAKLAELYRQASVLVLPSVDRTCYGKPVRVSELLGLVVLEAMASGTPVIASRVGGVAEIVAHGDSGFLVESGNVAELRARIEQVLGDAALCRRLGRHARETVLERYTWSACAQRCLAAYHELITARS